MKVTINRPSGPRTEECLPGQSWWTPTSLLKDLLNWLDSGKGWGDIASDAARGDAVSALRALADQIEATKTAPLEECRRANRPETAAGSYSPYYGTPVGLGQSQ